MRRIVMSVVLLFLLTREAAAHGKGTIVLGAKTVGVGGELSVQGMKLPKGASLLLQLRGSLQTYALGNVSTDDEGRFNAHFVLPAAARVGSYAVVVVAGDGDIAARADLAITAAANVAQPEPSAMAGMAGMAGMPNMSGPHASAEALDIPVRTSRLEWIAIIAIIALSMGAGVALLRSAKAATVAGIALAIWGGGSFAADRPVKNAEVITLARRLGSAALIHQSACERALRKS